MAIYERYQVQYISHTVLITHPDLYETYDEAKSYVEKLSIRYDETDSNLVASIRKLFINNDRIKSIRFPDENYSGVGMSFK